MVAVAAGLSLTVLASSGRVLQFHEWLCRTILLRAGVPTPASSLMAIAPGLPSVEVPVVVVPPMTSVRTATLAAVGSVLVALVLLHRYYPLARTFLAVTMALIIVAVTVGFLNPAFTIDSDAYTKLWLRTQFVLWLLLPWIMTFLVLPIEPSPLRGVGWILTVGAYGLIWSAFRLAFCLAVFHHTGIAFSTMLWFNLGPLSDLLYILVFYSLAVRRASARLCGRRP